MIVLSKAKLHLNCYCNLF